MTVPKTNQNQLNDPIFMPSSPSRPLGRFIPKSPAIRLPIAPTAVIAVTISSTRSRLLRAVSSEASEKILQKADRCGKSRFAQECGRRVLDNVQGVFRQVLTPTHLHFLFSVPALHPMHDVRFIIDISLSSSRVSWIALCSRRIRCSRRAVAFFATRNFSSVEPEVALTTSDTVDVWCLERDLLTFSLRPRMRL